MMFYIRNVSKSESEWQFATLRRFPPIFSEDLLLMTVSGIRYSLIIGTKLEVEFIPETRIVEWSEDEDENGISTKVPLGRNWDFGNNAKYPFRPVLERFPAGSEAWRLVESPSTFLLMFILQGQSVLHGTKVLRRAFWKRPFFKRKLFSEAYFGLQREALYRTLIMTNLEELCLAPLWARKGPKGRCSVSTNRMHPSCRFETTW
jgi:hypothetical protein